MVSACQRSLLTAANKAGFPALLGPHVLTLPQWANVDTPSFQNYDFQNHDFQNHDFQNQSLATKTLAIADKHMRELMLVEALEGHGHLHGKASPWSLASNLLDLFDELSATQFQLPDNEYRFTQQLANAYGLPRQQHPFAQREASLVYQLWQATREQLAAMGFSDAITAYHSKLRNRVERLHRVLVPQHFYYVGLTPLSAVESSYLSALAQQHRVTWITHQTDGLEFYLNATNAHAANTINNTINNAINNIMDSHPQHPTVIDYLLLTSGISPLGDLTQRKAVCLAKFPQSPIQDSIMLYAAHSSEIEAQAIDLQIRHWVQQGKQRIAFVTNNRKLARRVRALLERAGIHLQDQAGWNLATTNSATSLELWLRCVESDFHYLPFLDLMKSPHIFATRDAVDSLNTVYRFEKTIVYPNNLASGIDRYLRQTQFIIQRMPQDLQDYYRPIIPLLERFQQTAAPLTALLAGKHPAHRFLDTLTQSLQALELSTSLANDAAGQRLLDTLAALTQAALRVPTLLSWNEFRMWLGQTLESERFRPPHQHSQVQIMGLDQSDLQMFDAIVIGAAESEFLPGHPATSPFFNDTVRQSLGLEGLHVHKNRRFSYFRRLLALAEPNASGTPAKISAESTNILITLRRMENDEPIVASPWVESLQMSHTYFYQHDLAATHLEHWLRPPAPQPTAVADTADTAVNANTHKESDISRATLTPALVPIRFSASAYQELMDCPYKFFASRCLRLAAADRVKAYLEKSDYGERVHRCLQAFHVPVPGLLPPFTGSVNKDNRQLAIEHLLSISDQVFSRDIEDNFAHRAWRETWGSIVPLYIDWLTTHQQEWRFNQAELVLKADISATLSISARLDRIDRNPDGLAIIDYKTGIVAKTEAILCGESVQLPFYAWALQQSDPTNPSTPVAEIAHLALTAADVRLKNRISGDQLQALSQRNAERLLEILGQIRSGQALPAWGDAAVCEHCEAEGLCRKEYRQ